MESTGYCSLPLTCNGYNCRQESKVQNTGQISLPTCTCSGFFGSTEMGGSVDTRNMKNTVEGPRSVSLPSRSSFICSGKETEVENTRQSGEIPEDSAMDYLSALSCLRLQLGTQQPYHPYTPPIPETKKRVVGKEVMDLQGSPPSYEVQENYDSNFQNSPLSYEVQGNCDFSSFHFQHSWNPKTDAWESTSINGNSYQVYQNTPQILLIFTFLEI